LKDGRKLIAEYEETCRLDASVDSATSRSILPPLSETSLLQPNGTLIPGGNTHWTLEDVNEDELGDRAPTTTVVDIMCIMHLVVMATS